MSTGCVTKSPLQIIKEQEQYCLDKEKAADARSNCPQHNRIKEHTKIRSKTTGKEVEISLGPNHSGQVPANPFASLAQEGYLHSHPEKLGAKKLAEFDAATKGKHLPKRVGK